MTATQTRCHRKNQDRTQLLKLATERERERRNGVKDRERERQEGRRTEIGC